MFRYTPYSQIVKRREKKSSVISSKNKEYFFFVQSFRFINRQPRSFLWWTPHKVCSGDNLVRCFRFLTKTYEDYIRQVRLRYNSLMPSNHQEFCKKDTIGDAKACYLKIFHYEPQSFLWKTFKKTLTWCLLFLSHWRRSPCGTYSKINMMGSDLIQ